MVGDLIEHSSRVSLFREGAAQYGDGGEEEKKRDESHHLLLREIKSFLPKQVFPSSSSLWIRLMIPRVGKRRMRRGLRGQIDCHHLWGLLEDETPTTVWRVFEGTCFGFPQRVVKKGDSGRI